MRGIVFGDIHGGSKFGLTHPDYQPPIYESFMLPFWTWWENEMRHIGDLDFAVGNGDLVEGPGKKQNHEHLTTDMTEQQEIAARAIEIIPAKRVFLTYGTPYHVTGNQDWEDGVAELVGAEEIKEQMRIRYLGATMQFRHHGGRSDTPYGQGTQIFKEWVRDRLQADIYEYEGADAVFRNHVHYYFKVENAVGQAVSVPCLKLPLEVYGRKLRTMLYDIGYVIVEIDEEGEVHTRKRLMPFSVYGTDTVETVDLMEDVA